MQDLTELSEVPHNRVTWHLFLLSTNNELVVVLLAQYYWMAGAMALFFSTGLCYNPHPDVKNLDFTVSRHQHSSIDIHAEWFQRDNSSALSTMMVLPLLSAAGASLSTETSCRDTRSIWVVVKWVEASKEDWDLKVPDFLPLPTQFHIL